MVDASISRDLEAIREELHAVRSVLDPASIHESVVNIQAHSGSLVFDSRSFDNETDYINHKGYMNTASEGYKMLEDEMEKLAKLDELSETGMDYVNMLYCYRPVSRAMPEVVIDSANGNLSSKQVREMEVRQNEIDRKAIEVMRPEIMKLNDLFSFTVKGVEQLRASFDDFLQYLVGLSVVNVKGAQAGKKTDPVPESMPFLGFVRRESQYASLVRLIDVLVILDYLKYAKSASLGEDFERYKRALRTQVHGKDAIEEQVLLQAFLSHQNSRKRKHFIFQYMCDELHRPYPNTTRGPHAVLRNLLFYVVQQLEQKKYATPQEKFRFLRVMAHLVLLIDYKESDHTNDGDESSDLVKGAGLTKRSGKSKFKLDPEDKIFDRDLAEYYSDVRTKFKEYPVVPLYGDMTLTMVFALDLSPRFDMKTQGPAWGSKPDDRVIANYDLEHNWDFLRESCSEYQGQFTILWNRIKDPAAEDSVNTATFNQETLKTAELVFKLVRLGLGHVLHMSCLLHQMLAWKYSHPCPDSRLEELGVSAESAGAEYERVLRYNLTPRQLSVTVDVVGMVKSLSGMIAKGEFVFAPLVRYHIHHRLQKMVQGDLLPILHRADKRKLPFLPALLHLRALLADWSDGEEPLENYRTHKRRMGEAVVENHPARVVGPTHTQLHLMQCHLAALFTDDVSAKTGRGYLKKKTDIEPADVAKFKAFLAESYTYSRVLNFSTVLRTCSDMGGMWFREFYLEKTHCVQFPIEMSLPWILTEHVVTHQQQARAAQRHDPPLVENVLFLLDVYNDAANHALQALHQQHLYNEIEAEANLVLDQVVYFLATDIYDYYKNVAASSRLDRGLKGKLEELKGYSYLTMLSRRHHTPLAQRNAQLLGRSVDLNFLLGRHLNDKLRWDVETAIQRFESTDCTGIVELEQALQCLRATHGALRSEVDLDAWEEVLDECNESFSPSLKTQGRIGNQFIFSLVEDVLSNFSYNNVSERFVQAPIVLQPVAYGRAPSKKATESLFGPACSKAYDWYGRLTRGFFGREHIEAFISLVGYSHMQRLVDAIMQMISERLQKLSLYVSALLDHLPVEHNVDKDLSEHATKEYRRLFSTFEDLLDFDDLKPEVFQSFREIGNAVVFIRNLSEALETAAQSEFINLSPLLGLVPDSKQTDKRLYNKHAPIVKAFKKLTTAVDSASVKDLPVAASTIFDIAFSANAEAPNSNGSSPDLFQEAMERLRGLFREHDLFLRWGPFPHHSAPALSAGKDNKSFFRLWSALVFLYCVEEDGGSSNSTVEGEVVEPAGGDVSNEEEFGHGLVVAGALFLHLLKQKHAFLLTDHTHHLVKVQQNTRAKYSLLFAKQDTGGKLDASMRTEDADNVAHDNDGNLPNDVSFFLDNARLAYELHEEYFRFFEANMPMDGLTQRQREREYTVFHPPRDQTNAIQ